MAEPAVHKLKELEPAVDIVWRAFELRPEPVPRRDPNGEYLQRVWNDSVYPLARRLNIKMKLPPLQPRSRLAHQASHWAKGEGRFEQYNQAVFRAFFESGRDIGDIEILTSLASDLGLESERLRAALVNEAYRDSVLADERDAEQLGIHSVPAFVVNRKAALSGVQPVENLKALIERARGFD